MKHINSDLSPVHISGMSVTKSRGSQASSCLKKAKWGREGDSRFRRLLNLKGFMMISYHPIIGATEIVRSSADEQIVDSDGFSAMLEVFMTSSFESFLAF